MADRDIRDASLEYHRQFPPGKISLLPTKQLTNQRDLALAYTPGVAAACDEIAARLLKVDCHALLHFQFAYLSPVWRRWV